MRPSPNVGARPGRGRDAGPRAGGYHYQGPGAGRHENHAWAEAYLPGAGWTGWDPVNCIRTGEAHVQITAGRDYADVSPARGVYRGVSRSQLEVELEMEAG